MPRLLLLSSLLTLLALFFLASQQQSPSPVYNRQIRTKFANNPQNTIISPKIPTIPVHHFTRKSKHINHKADSTISTKNKERWTVVTGLWDIGRGEWWLYRRPYSVYLRFLTPILRLRVNLVVFIEEKGAAFVRRIRRRHGLLSQTMVRVMSVDQLELSRYKERGKEILEREFKGYPSGWEKDMREHPEASSFLYDIVVNSKAFLLALAAREDPFDTEFFFWLDAGYGHGESKVFPPDHRLDFTPLTLRGKISLIQLYPFNSADFPLEKLYRHDISLFSGGFLGGDKDSIFQFHSLYTDLFLELLHKGYLDDDQTLLVLLFNAHPQLFNPILGDWFDGIRRFHHRSSVLS